MPSAGKRGTWNRGNEVLRTRYRESDQSIVLAKIIRVFARHNKKIRYFGLVVKKIMEGGKVWIEENF